MYRTVDLLSYLCWETVPYRAVLRIRDYLASELGSQCFQPHQVPTAGGRMVPPSERRRQLVQHSGSSCLSLTGVRCSDTDRVRFRVLLIVGTCTCYLEMVGRGRITLVFNVIGAELSRFRSGRWTGI